VRVVLEAEAPQDSLLPAYRFSRFKTPAEFFLSLALKFVSPIAIVLDKRSFNSQGGSNNECN